MTHQHIDDFVSQLPDPAPGESDLWTVEEIAAKMKCSVATVRGMVQRGELPAATHRIGTGGKMFWDADHIRAAMARPRRLRVNPITPPTAVARVAETPATAEARCGN